MSIDDQESFRLQQQMSGHENFQLNQFTEFKNMNIKDIQNSLNQLTNQQQKLKHNFNGQQIGGGKRINDSHAAAIPSDHTDSQVYADDGTMPCSGASCNYCNGSVEITNEGRVFVHEHRCWFHKNQYVNELGENDLDDYQPDSPEDEEQQYQQD